MGEEFQNSHLWSKRFLPHYDASLKYQMITYRLADSLPQGLLGAPHSDAGMDPNYRKEVESILDKGYGCCLLQSPAVAEKVIEAWKFFDKEKYDLVAYVVMPNHVHVLIKAYPKNELGRIVWSWKRHVSKFVFECKEYSEIFGSSMRSFAKVEFDSRAPESKQRFLRPASECGAPSKTKRSLWQREYWDRFIRDENHFQKAVEYIHENPAKAGLIKNSKDWLWSSAGEQRV